MDILENFNFYPETRYLASLLLWFEATSLGFSFEMLLDIYITKFAGVEKLH